MNSLTELPSELKCHHELHRILWGTIRCPDCDHRLLYRKNYEYCPHCHKKTSVRAESAFRHSKLTFRQIWAMIWLWQHGSSIGEIKRQLNLSYLTIRRWLMKLRILLPEDNTSKLYSEVEVDESYFGINIHRTDPYNAAKYINSWSAGCQVINNPKDFKSFMDIVEQSRKIYGNKFTYTLIEEKDLV